MRRSAGKKRGFNYYSPIAEYGALLEQLSTGARPIGGKTPISGLRKLSFQNPVLRSFIRLCKSGVIGNVPITPTFSAVISNTVRKRLRDLWKQFCVSPVLYDRMSMLELQKAIVESLLVDGRVFIVLRFDPDLPFGLGFVVLPREMFLYSHNNNHERIAAGRRYDTNGRLVSYFFNDFTSTTFLQSTVRPGSFLGVPGGPKVEIPAEFVLDIHEPGLIAASYNYPPILATIVESAQRIDYIDRNTLSTMEESSKRGGFVTTDATTPIPKEAKLNLSDVEEEKAIGSHIDILPPGAAYTPYQAGWPSGDSLGARKEILRTLAAASGVDYASLNSDQAGNFSALRHFALQTRDTYREIQASITQRMMKPILRGFLQFIPGISATARTQANESSFETRQYVWVDPLKDTNANKQLVRMGIKDLQGLAREQGSDLRDNLQGLLLIGQEYGVTGENDLDVIRKVLSVLVEKNDPAMMVDPSNTENNDANSNANNDDDSEE